MVLEICPLLIPVVSPKVFAQCIQYGALSRARLANKEERGLVTTPRTIHDKHLQSRESNRDEDGKSQRQRHDKGIEDAVVTKGVQVLLETDDWVRMYILLLGQVYIHVL